MCEPGPVKSLALLCLQSNRYVEDSEYRDAVDAILNNPKYDAVPELLEALESLREVVRSSLLPAMNEAAKHLPEGHYARQWSVSDDLAFQQAARETDNAIAKARGTNNG